MPTGADSIMSKTSVVATKVEVTVQTDTDGILDAVQTDLPVAPKLAEGDGELIPEGAETYIPEGEDTVLPEYEEEEGGGSLEQEENGYYEPEASEGGDELRSEEDLLN